MNQHYVQKSYTREELMTIFRNGQIPTENHFKMLIDSMINKEDDGFEKDDKEGFVITATNKSKRFLTLYKDVNDLDPFFFFEKDDKGEEAIKFKSADADTDDKTFFFGRDGSLGIGDRCNKEHRMHVDGFVGMDGRIGTYESGEVLADGRWKTILDNLKYCNAFEVVARTGKPLKNGNPKFALFHAIAVATFGRRGSKIKKTSSHYGFFWNKINLRWRGSDNNYRLEIKTNSNYGNNIKIFYKITRLWDDELFMPDNYYKSDGDAVGGNY